MIDDGYSDPMDYMDHLEAQASKYCDEMQEANYDYGDSYDVRNSFDDDDEDQNQNEIETDVQV